MITFLRQALPLLDGKARRRFVLSVLAMMATAVMEAAALALIAPLMQILTAPDMKSDSRLVKDLSDLLGGPTPSRLALYLGAGTAGLYILKSALAVFTIRWSMGFSLVEETKLVRRLMDSYMRAPYIEHLTTHSAERIRTLTHSMRTLFQQGFLGTFSALGDLLSVVLVGVILLIANPVVAVAAGLYFGVITFLYQRVTNQAIARRAAKLHADQAVDFRTIQQALTAVKEIKVRGVEDVFTEEVYGIRRSLVSAYRTMALVSATPRYILELAMVGAAVTIAALSFSTEPISTATATLGLFLVGGFRLLAPLNKIIFGNALAKGAIPSLESVRADLAAAPEDRFGEETAQAHRASGAPAPEPLQLRTGITLDRVCFSYVPGTPVLRDITARIDAGESVGIVGGSGAGKSTLFDVLLGLLRPDSGRVLIDGLPIDAVSRAWQDVVGYVPQSTALIDDTIRANVLLGLQGTDDDVWRALGLAQLEDLVRDLPDGLDTRIGESGTRLSGGQRQRLGVARALFRRPSVLLFDEATSALDNETEHRLNDVLESLRGTITMVIIAHRLSTVRRCDRVLYLESGRLVAEGSFEELTASITGFARLVELASLEV